jgi:hypothetical protein
VIADDLSRLSFTVENRAGGPHTAALSIEGLPPGPFTVIVNGGEVQAIRHPGMNRVELPISGAAVTVRIQRQ